MRLRALVLALLLVGLAAGCGPPQAGVEISLFTWTRPDELRVNQRLVDKFEQAHPDIRVNLINEPGLQAMVKLQAMIAAGNPPDVMSIHGALFIPLAAEGSLLDLGPFVEKDASFQFGDFYPALVELCRYNGRLYSVPRYTSVYVLFYNRDLFDAAGLSYPDESWTWDTYLDAAQRLTVHSSDPAKVRYGCLIDFWGARIYPWVWASGGDILNPSRTRCVIDSPEAQGALQFLVDLRRRWQVAPSTSRAEQRETVAMFSQGKVGMYMTGAWDVQNFKDVPGLRWDIAPLPKKMTRATLLGTENYAIAAGTKHPEAAWELFKFLLSPDSQTVMATELEKQPSRQSVANGPYLQQKVPYHRQVFVDALGYARQAPNIPRWEKLARHFDTNLDLIWAGEVTVAEGTRRIAEAVTKELQTAPPPPR